MNTETFSFELLDKDKPEIVIKNSLRQIDEATRGYVKGNIEKYDGQIRSYKKNLGLVIPTLQKEVTIDIQKDLGEQNNEDYKFEVFLTVKGLEHYKYRVMFVNHGTLSYPVTIIMNDTIMKKRGVKDGYFFAVRCRGNCKQYGSKGERGRRILFHGVCQADERGNLCERPQNAGKHF